MTQYLLLNAFSRTKGTETGAGRYAHIDFAANLETVMATSKRQTGTRHRSTSQGAELAQSLRDAGSTVSENLRSVGVNTDEMAEIPERRVTELQEMLMDEIRARPLRALGWAAAAGLVVGLWAAK